ncbi:MAG: ATP-binding protein [Actinomycetota bacterium]|nr:ATP-binding protein [Actinomycetota bacterium]
MAAPILVVSGCSAVGKSTVSRLLVGSLDSSVHIPTDVFLRFFDDPFPDPATPHAAHYYEVVGAALAAAAGQLALGGYTVVLDGPMFPGGAAGMAEICGRRGVRVHYAVLRADLATCCERAARRDPAEPRDLDEFRALHARFVDLGESETNVIDASGSVEEVAASVLSTFRSGRLALKPRSSANQGRST